MGVLDLLFPPSCVGCKTWGAYLCSSCVNLLGVVKQPSCPMCERPSILGMTHERCKRPWGMDGLLSVIAYKGVGRKLVTQMKYSLVRDLVSMVVEVMVSMGEWHILERGEWYVVPVPLHTKRERWRGFNQAREVALGFSQAMHLSYVDVLERVKDTPPQMKLPRKKRMENMKGAFEVKHPDLIKDKHILLLDDVWTTGSTMREAAKLLKRKGAKSVWGVVVARA